MKMHYNVSITSGEIVVGKDFLNYQEVLDDFCNAKCVVPLYGLPMFPSCRNTISVLNIHCI